MPAKKKTQRTPAPVLQSAESAPETNLGSLPDNDPETAANRGRPTGAKTIKVEVVAETSRCPQCGSTERERYSNTTELEYGGQRNGQTYTHIVWRSTRCVTCGQARRDKSFENRIEVDDNEPEDHETESKNPG